MSNLKKCLGLRLRFYEHFSRAGSGPTCRLRLLLHKPKARDHACWFLG
jgi:hypothetical protein